MPISQNNIMWKSITALMGFLLTMCLMLIGVQYSNLVDADQECKSAIASVKDKVQVNCDNDVYQEVRLKTVEEAIRQIKEEIKVQSVIQTQMYEILKRIERKSDVERDRNARENNAP